MAIWKADKMADENIKTQKTRMWHRSVPNSAPWYSINGGERPKIADWGEKSQLTGQEMQAWYSAVGTFPWTGRLNSANDVIVTCSDEIAWTGNLEPVWLGYDVTT
jgi:hypothetical protein